MTHFPDLEKSTRRDRVQWETREITMSARTTRQEAKTVLTEYAEYGHWELARLRLYQDGRRWALLRRRKVHVTRDTWLGIAAE